jgi:hypothetical protein
MKKFLPLIKITFFLFLLLQVSLTDSHPRLIVVSDTFVVINNFMSVGNISQMVDGINPISPLTSRDYIGTAQPFSAFHTIHTGVHSCFIPVALATCATVSSEYTQVTAPITTKKLT